MDRSSSNKLLVGVAITAGMSSAVAASQFNLSHRPSSADRNEQKMDGIAISA
jgi:hypothetical protein